MIKQFASWILAAGSATILFAQAQAPATATQKPATNSTPVSPQAQEQPLKPLRTTPGLTAEQREKLKEHNEKRRQEQADLLKKLQDARKELEQLTQAETIDEKGIREQAAQIGQFEGEMALIRARHYKEIREILPPDQAQRFENRPSREDVRKRLQERARGTNQPTTRRLLTLPEVRPPSPSTNQAQTAQPPK